MSESNHPQLVESLLRPDVYPHPVDEVVLHETHISWVFLAGEFAYKLKKPVNLGFVDFSTLERRKHFCQEELRLNRRLAKSLYLEVLGILGSPETPRFEILDSNQATSESAFEFAVKMRRFPGEAELVQVLARRELTTDQIDRLALDVAEFHARIAVAPAEKCWGTPDEVMRPVRENFQHLRKTPLPAELPKLVAKLEAWSEREFEKQRSLFGQRKDQGFIRECHGDMHLGNMLLDKGRVVIFDCLEFNESLRWVDVQSEIAFLVMDLEDRKEPAFANRLLNTYLEVTGDYAGASLLPFYQCYRAVVRAKVAALRSLQVDREQGDPGELRKIEVEAANYLKLAERYTQQTSPCLLVTHGLSGSGKTQGTEAIVAELGAVRLRSDVERKRLAGLAAGESSNSSVGMGIYSAELTRRTYDRLAELADELLRGGRPVIIDAANLLRWQRDVFRQVAAKYGVSCLFLEFVAPEAVLRKRVEQRQSIGKDASEATLSVLKGQLGLVEPLGEAERKSTISVDTTTVDCDKRLLHELRRRF